MKMSSLDRTLLLFTGFLAAYQIAIGIDQMDSVSITAYTIAFGVILVAGLLLIILGFEVLDAPIVVIISTIIPLALSLGLIWQHLASLRTVYLIFTIISFLAVVLTRSIAMQNKLPVIVIAITHGIAGLTIFLLPIILAAQGQVKPLFSLVGIGGALIGIGGLLLSFLKTGKPILSRDTIMRLFPMLLLLTTALFVAGFKLG
ncbi:MAG TPA: hypothetical protein PKE35_07625 [Anaerolineales bacterium]|nr:hypothetical protein [Anaerolineales bacterium]HMV96043.1 hypothetical protein [Anaerolineales bacterium]HMX18620.1 hypothetical protein [Anaerolineales bacterium]HMX74106.1 hypothetical protein [Anaerolineales bacterium]HMZ42263.1 hypothetical protein [Anaerolineales bacterium]